MAGFLQPFCYTTHMNPTDTFKPAQRAHTSVLATAEKRARTLVMEAPPGLPEMSRPELLKYGLSQEISALEAAGRRVILFLDVPELGWAITETPIHAFWRRTQDPEPVNFFHNYLASRAVIELSDG